MSSLPVADAPFVHAQAPLVHVIIINWNGMEHVDACFNSLLAGTYPNARYILVDNGSTDGSPEYVRTTFGHDERVEIVECGANLGWSGGNNVGIRKALAEGADYILLLNNDTWTDPEAIQHLVEQAEGNPAIGALAPKMLFFSQPWLINSVGVDCSIIGGAWDIGLGRVDTPQWNQVRPVTAICGGAFFIRAAVLEKTGILPEEFGIYFDDVDLCLRIWSAGYTLFSCPQAIVRHKFSATMGKGTQAHRKYYLNTRNRLWLVIRNYPSHAAVSIACAIFIGECRAVGRALLNRESWRVKAHLKAWWDAVRYCPSALKARHNIPGTPGKAFWRLVHQDRMFYPGIPLPEDGWYPFQEAYQGTLYTPMSAIAKSEISAGTYRIRYWNKYPVKGTLAVDLRTPDGKQIHLETQEVGEQILDLPAGMLQFNALFIFNLEDTGEPVDIGGWIYLANL